MLCMVIRTDKANRCSNTFTDNRNRVHVHTRAFARSHTRTHPHAHTYTQVHTHVRTGTYAQAHGGKRAQLVVRYPHEKFHQICNPTYNVYTGCVGTGTQSRTHCNGSAVACCNQWYGTADIRITLLYLLSSTYVPRAVYAKSTACPSPLTVAVAILRAPAGRPALIAS